MFQPKFIKQGKLLQKGVRKFLKYKQDIISEKQLAKIKESSDAFDEALRNRDKEQVKRLAKDLTKVCEKSVPEYRNTSLRENLEVLFVAIVIAVGIRAYYLQPFKIPTGSMQPTLNGIIGFDKSDKPDFEKPGLPTRIWDRVQKGRKYVDHVMEEGGFLEEVVEETKFKFFTSTRFRFKDPSKDFSLPLPAKTIGIDFGLKKRADLVSDGKGSIAMPQNRYIEPGTIIARGYMETGDQVLVDKVSYHFRKPRRGEVFVFNTRGIGGIPLEDPAQGSMHYIKRLAGVPGDHLQVDPPRLMINGEEASEPGFRRVAHDEDYKPGYVRKGGNFYDVELEKEYGKRQYFAMGDNSDNSSDSRMWGAVPEPNLVGPALVVYWPFAGHWGWIR